MVDCYPCMQSTGLSRSRMLLGAFDGLVDITMKAAERRSSRILDMPSICRAYDVDISAHSLSRGPLEA